MQQQLPLAAISTSRPRAGTPAPIVADAPEIADSESKRAGGVPIGQAVVLYTAAVPVGLTWGALIGAEVGLPVVVTGPLLALVLVAVLVVLRRCHPGDWPAAVWTRRQLLLSQLTAGLTLALGLLAFPAHETVLGGRDPGVYVNTAVSIARTGRIHFFDPLLASLGTRIGDWVLSRAPEPWVRPGMPGYQIFDLNVFTFQPHGFHAWPALLAVGFATLGWSGLLYLPVVLRLWNLALTALVARAIAGPVAGLLAVAFLGTNVGALWYGRSHAAEILVQTCFLTAILFGVVAIRHRDPASAVLSGLAFGVVHITKIEFVQVPVFLLITLAVLHTRGWSIRSLLWFAAPYGTLLLHAGVHAVLFAPSYTVGQVLGILPRLDWNALGRADPAHPFVLSFWVDLIRSNAVPVAALAVFVILLIGGAIWFAHSARRYPAIFGVRATPLLLLFVAGLLLLLLSRGAALAAPEQVGPLEVVRFIGNPQSLRDVSLYVGVLGLGLTALGFLLGVGAARDTADRAVLGLFLVGAAPMLFVNWLAADHFWAGRRYVPLLIPAVSIYSAAAIVWSVRAVVRRRGEVVIRRGVELAGALVAAGLLVWNVRATLPLLGHVENAGAIEQLAGVAAAIPSDGVTLMPWEEYSGLMITPLVVQFGKPIMAVGSESVPKPGLHDLLMTLKQRGQHLYWLGVQPPGLAPGLVARPIGPVAFRVPRAEAPTDRLPEKVVWYDVPLVLYRIEDRAATRGGADQPASALLTPSTSASS